MMKMRSVCLPPGLVTPGMALASAVSGRDGNVLLAAGALLDSDILERLIRRGVEALWVKIPDERDEETIAFELRNAEERVNAIFRGHGSPARQELRQTILEFRQESLK
jgi:hypothetical protein